MIETTAPTISDGHVIERTDEVPAMYFSIQMGRDYGQPAGGWTQDRSKATVYESEKSAREALDGPLQAIAPLCKVVAK